MVSSRGALNSWDLLKVLALLLMFVDHTGVFLLPSDDDAYYLRAIGRGAAPIFLFLAGYARNYRFSWELFVLAVAFAAYEWVYFWHVNTLNILFTILFCRFIFQWFESRERIIRKPVEWFIGAVSLFVTGVICQYGSMGFLMALAGYMRRHETAYAPRLRWGLTAAMVATYAFYQVYFFTPPIQPVIASVMIVGVMLLCMRFELKPVTAPWLPHGAKRFLKLISYYSGYIYVAHIVALMTITGISA